MCPLRFKKQHLDKEVSSAKENDYFSLYGTLVQLFFENYCNIWRYTTPYIFEDDLKKRLEKLMDSMLLTATVNWDAFGASLSKDEIVDKAFNDIWVIMKDKTLNYFLNTKSEVSMEVALKSGHMITGRLDFIHTFPLDETILIFDGKGVKDKKKPRREQLYFYSLLYYLHYQKLPDQLGFFFYQYNEFVPIVLTMDILNEFRAKLSLDVKAMTGSGSFDATPSGKSCKYCPYLPTCMEGLRSKASRARPSKITDVDGIGLMELGL